MPNQCHIYTLLLSFPAVILLVSMAVNRAALVVFTQGVLARVHI